MIRYKLFKVRKDGSIGPLFINARQRVPIGIWIKAEYGHHKKGFAYRPGWHLTASPVAPHLSMKNRRWYRVETWDETVYQRPVSQGGEWILAQYIRVIGPV